MMNTGQTSGLVLLYLAIAGYVTLMLRIFFKILFRAEIEKRRRRQFAERNGGATDPPGSDASRGWANTWLPRNPVINQQAQDGNSAGKLATAAPIVKRTIVLVSIAIALGL